MRAGRSGIRPRPGGDEGQATVELALVLPFVVVLLLSVVQIGLVVRAQLRVEHAAHEGARAAAVADDPVAVGRRVALAAVDDPDRTEVMVTSEQVGGEDAVRVSVSWRLTGTLPLVGSAVDGRTVQASAALRVEP